MTLIELVAAHRHDRTDAELAAASGGLIPQEYWRSMSRTPPANGDGTEWQPRQRRVDTIAHVLGVTGPEVRAAIRASQPGAVR